MSHSMVVPIGLGGILGESKAAWLSALDLISLTSDWHGSLINPGLLTQAGNQGELSGAESTHLRRKHPRIDSQSKQAIKCQTDSTPAWARTSLRRLWGLKHSVFPRSPSWLGRERFQVNLGSSTDWWEERSRAWQLANGRVGEQRRDRWPTAWQVSKNMMVNEN